MDLKQYVQQYPPPIHEYLIPECSGKFEIKEEDKELFTQIYNTPLTNDQTCGNGEIAIYWLFQNNNIQREKRSDFSIDGKNVEVKSYPNHNSKLTLGKFKQDVDSRYIINSLFSFYNQTQQYPNYYAETSFNINNIKDSYSILLDVPESNIFSTNTESCINKKAEEIINFSTGSLINEMAINTMLRLAINKLSLKPGDSNYILNIKPTNPTDIYIWKIELEKVKNLTYEEWEKNIDIQSCELKINFNIFN